MLEARVVNVRDVTGGASAIGGTVVDMFPLWLAFSRANEKYIETANKQRAQCSCPLPAMTSGLTAIKQHSPVRPRCI
jgi:hypothetical protein